MSRSSPRCRPDDRPGTEVPLAAPTLRDLARLAALGGWLWLWPLDDGRLAVQRSRLRRRPPLARAADSTALLLHQLTLAHGPAASAVAQRTLRLHEGRACPVGAHRAGVALRTAADSESLLLGVNLSLRLQFSAEHGGLGFLACALRVGVDPAALPLERRQALDAALARQLGAEPGAAPATVAAWVEAALRAPLH